MVSTNLNRPIAPSQYRSTEPQRSSAYYNSIQYHACLNYVYTTPACGKVSNYRFVDKLYPYCELRKNSACIGYLIRILSFSPRKSTHLLKNEVIENNEVVYGEEEAMAAHSSSGCHPGMIQQSLQSRRVQNTLSPQNVSHTPREMNHYLRVASEPNEEDMQPSVSVEEIMYIEEEVVDENSSANDSGSNENVGTSGIGQEEPMNDSRVAEVDLLEDILQDEDREQDTVMVEHEGGETYEIYEEEVHFGADGMAFLDEEGNTLYLEKPLDRRRLRFLKEEHMDFIISKVATSEGRTRISKPVSQHECPYCGKLLRYPSRIKEHMRMHEGAKPFSCDICHTRFSQKSALNVHKRKHRGEKKYPCQWDCGKRFVSSSAARMHEKSHTGYKPYACPICNRCFSKRHVEMNRKLELVVIKHHLLRHQQCVHRGEDSPEGIRIKAEIDTSLTEECKAVVREVVEEVQADKKEKSWKVRS